MKTILVSLLLLPTFAFGASGDIGASVKRLDSAIASALSSKEVEMNPKASDSVWVRRAYLDIVGRIPTADEAAQYIDSKSPGKRDSLIRELLDSDGRASHDFSFWADVLRVPSRVPGQNGGAVMGAYIDWLREKFTLNTPYDELVTSLVTAKGYAGENPAVGFTLRDRGMPLDHMSATVETFLGTQILCAQCHDHPFEDWTQQDFYKLAAFSHGMRSVRSPQGINEKVRAATKGMPKAKRRKLSRQVRSLFAPLKNALVEESSRNLKLPDDYQYDDGRPGDLIVAEVPFGPDADYGKGGSKVDAYAEWMTSVENSRFAMVGANRMWKRLFGVGVLEPVTDFDQVDEAFSRELLEALGELFVSLEYDMRAFTRVLANTDLYSRQAMPLDSEVSYSFAGPALRRMSAEQVWDSMVTLIQEDPDSVRPVTRGRGTRGKLLDSETYRRMTSIDGEQMKANLEQMDTLAKESAAALEPIRKSVESLMEKKREGRGGIDDEAKKVARELTEFSGELFEKFATLAMIDGETGVDRINNPLTNGSRQLAKTLASNFPKTRRILAGSFSRYQKNKGEGGGRKIGKALRAEFRAIRKAKGKAAADAFLKEKRGGDAGQANRQFVRAAWLPQPAPEGHFLRTFGQSDREASMNGNTEATVPQVLALMNGDVFPSLLSAEAKMRRAFDAAPDVSAQADAIYLAILARRPDAEERALVMERLRSNRPKVAEGVLWALMNSPQFLFIE